MISWKILGLAGLIAIGTSFQAGWAHHSGAMFDHTKTVTVTGTVRDFEWSNPHVWLDLMVPDGKGGTTSWAFEGGSVNAMFSLGWHPRSVKPGDEVTVTGIPARTGGFTAELHSVKRPNGTTVPPNAAPLHGV